MKNTPCQRCCIARPDVKLREPIEGSDPGRHWLCTACLSEIHDAVEARRAKLEQRRARPASKPPVEHTHVPPFCGLSHQQVRDMHAAQDGRCGICQRTIRTRGRGVAVDHCHATGIVRGLLCHRCNVWIGKRGDDADLFERAAEWCRRGPAWVDDPERPRVKAGKRRPT